MHHGAKQNQKIVLVMSQSFHYVFTRKALEFYMQAKHFELNFLQLVKAGGQTCLHS